MIRIRLKKSIRPDVPQKTEDGLIILPYDTSSR